jgi:hypothetical protein
MLASMGFSTPLRSEALEEKGPARLETLHKKRKDTAVLIWKVLRSISSPSSSDTVHRTHAWGMKFNWAVIFQLFKIVFLTSSSHGNSRGNLNKEVRLYRE